MRQMSTKFIEQINLVSSMIEIIKSKALQSSIHRLIFRSKVTTAECHQKLYEGKKLMDSIDTRAIYPGNGLGPGSCEKLGCQYHADLLCSYHHHTRTRPQTLWFIRIKGWENSHGDISVFVDVVPVSYLVTNPSRGLKWRQSFTNQLN